MASDGSPGDEFGQAVALDGDTALLMACGADGGSSGYIYTRSDDIWSEQAKLTPHPGPSACGFIFAGGVALHGDTAMIATWYPGDFETPQAGSFAIYTNAGGKWTEQAILVADEGEFMSPLDNALDGDTLVALGASNSDPQPRAFVFTRAGGQWTEQAPIVAPDGAIFQSSFPGVALDGDTTLVVGASQEQEPRVFVFVRDGDTWTLQAELTPSDGASGLDFGWSVAVDGNTAVVGASRTDFGILGKVYVYTREGETWTEQAQLTAPIEGDEDGNFGRTVALDGDTALVGARGLGAAFIFNRAGETWSAEATLTPADGAAFAYKVALDGDTALVGTNSASIFDPNPLVPGWAYVFDTRPPAPTIRLDPSALDFGQVPVGQHSLLDLTVTLENNGSAGLEVGALALGGEHPSDFELVEDPCSGQVIDPGDACSVTLRFAPTALGGREASLDVPSNAPSGLASAILIGEGLEGPPTIRWDPDSLHAVLTPGEASGEALTLSNLGTVDLEWQVLSGDGLGLAEPLRPRRPVTMLDTAAHVGRADPSSRLTTANGDPRVLYPRSPRDRALMPQAITFTHSQSTEIVIPNTPRCAWEPGTFTTANQFLRAFTLPDFGILGAFDITEVAFGVESLNAEVDITVNLYTLDGVLFVYDNLTLLASQTVTLSPQEGTIVTVPLAAAVPAGATLVMEVAAPDMNNIGQFTAGSNAAGEFAPSYLATPECGGISPTPFEGLGAPGVHLVMSVTGTLDCDLPSWLAAEPMSGIVAGGASAPITVTLDSSGLPLGEFGANLCLATNDPAKPFVIVPAGLSVVDEVIPPVADVSPASIALTIDQPTDSDTQTLTIGNPGNAGPLEWHLLPPADGGDGCYDPAEVPWLAVEPTSGSVPPGEIQEVVVTASGVLHDNGPLVNRPGSGPGGADLSILESLTSGMGTLGWNVVLEAGFRAADDFEAAEDWQVDAMTFFVYQPDSPPTSTIDRVNYQIWDGPPDDPESSVVFGDTVTNRLASTEWTGAYRVAEENPFDTSRPIMKVTAEGGFALPPGTYWVDAQFGDDGTVVGPPWQPPVAILGEIATGNAMHLGNGGWEPMLDQGTETAQGMPFRIHGLPSLSDGILETTLCIATNDPKRPLAVVPVTLIVTGGGEGVFAAAALEVDSEVLLSNGNGVFEPGELVEVAPAWGNDGASPGFLSGAASDLAGPAGPTYTIVAADADYGAIAPGEAASCQESGLCYEMEIGPPGVARPAAHWDASFEEELSDETIKTWTLHIGDSFADVPRESLFYPWIETLLHHQVTGGCTAAGYCPAAANTRGQMAVFLLKASEDGDYLPPACVEGEEVFTDVSHDDIFCPWIEELAGRGVTAGCGGGNYCPNASVSRDQMAVFLLKALQGSGYVPPACSGVFEDVPCPSLFADWIEELVARQITAGCGGGNYCPAAAVSRDQMAVFLAKTFGLTLYGP